MLDGHESLHGTCLDPGSNPGISTKGSGTVKNVSTDVYALYSKFVGPWYYDRNNSSSKLLLICRSAKKDLRLVFQKLFVPVWRKLADAKVLKTLQVGVRDPSSAPLAPVA